MDAKTFLLKNSPEIQEAVGNGYDIRMAEDEILYWMEQYAQSKNRTDHELKTWPEYFEAVWDGRKAFEIRKNDRNFQVGDWLILREWGPITDYSGREIYAEVTYVLPGGKFGIEPGLCVLSIIVKGRKHEINE